MQDALLDLSSRLETIQNDLRSLATRPASLSVHYYPITLAEAETLTNRLAVMVHLWLQRPDAPPSTAERRLAERRVAQRRGGAGTRKPDDLTAA